MKFLQFAIAFNREIFPKHLFIFFITFVFVIGCSPSKPTEEKKEMVVEKTEPVIETESLNLDIIYTNQDELVYTTFQNNEKIILLKNITEYDLQEILQSKNKDFLILKVEQKNKKNTIIYNFNFTKHSISELKTFPKKYNLNIFHLYDSLLVINYYEIKKGTNDKNLTLYLGFTEIYDLSKNKLVKQIKPKKGDVLHTIIDENLYIFSDESKSYIYNVKSDKIINEFEKVFQPDRNNYLFSRVDEFFFYTKDKKLKDKSGNIYSFNELYRYDIKKEKSEMILDYNYEPKNISFSNDFKFLICDVNSPNILNIRSCCLIDVNSKAIKIVGEENPEKLKRVTLCKFSMDDNYIGINYIEEDTLKSTEKTNIRFLDNNYDVTLSQKLRLNSWFLNDILVTDNDEFISLKSKRTFVFDEGKIIFYKK